MRLSPRSPTPACPLKMNKCTLFSNKVEYIGHVILPGKLEVDRAHTASLKQAKPPTTKSELRSFLGLCNIYQRFILDFTGISHPLNQFLHKGTPEKFKLSDGQLKSFSTLIQKVCSPQIFALPKPDRPYSLDTDTLVYGICCALFQTHDDGKRKPV